MSTVFAVDCAIKKAYNIQNSDRDKLTNVFDTFITDFTREENIVFNLEVVFLTDIERKKKGLNPANSLWFWGAGTKPNLSSFSEKTKKNGAMISAVDLLKGIAVGAQMKNINVEGADGTLETLLEVEFA